MSYNDKYIYRHPSETNCLKNSSYLTPEDEKLIDSGEKTHVCIYNSVLDQEYLLDAKEVKNSLLSYVYKGDRTAYKCFNWAHLIPKTQSSKEDENEYLRQSDVASMLGVTPTRVSELHRFNFLQPCSKIGTSLLYFKSDVIKAMNESRVQFWLKSLNEK